MIGNRGRAFAGIAVLGLIGFAASFELHLSMGRVGVSHGLQVLLALVIPIAIGKTADRFGSSIETNRLSQRAGPRISILFRKFTTHD